MPGDWLTTLTAIREGNPHEAPLRRLVKRPTLDGEDAPPERFARLWAVRGRLATARGIEASFAT